MQLLSETKLIVLAFIWSERANTYHAYGSHSFRRTLLFKGLVGGGRKDREGK